jgi:hypothetical protein
MDTRGLDGLDQRRGWQDNGHAASQYRTLCYVRDGCNAMLISLSLHGKSDFGFHAMV